MTDVLDFTPPELSPQDPGEVSAEALILSAVGFAQRFGLEVPSDEVLKTAVRPAPLVSPAACIHLKDVSGNKHLYT